MGNFRKLQMCSLRELLEMCPSHKPMVQTNYNYELSSHPISNTQCDFFPGPGIRSRIRATNVQSCSVAPDLPLGISPPVTFKKEVSYFCTSAGFWMQGWSSAKSLQSCPTLCNPVDCSPPGSSVGGTLQARILE